MSSLHQRRTAESEHSSSSPAVQVRAEEEEVSLPTMAFFEKWPLGWWLCGGALLLVEGVLKYISFHRLLPLSVLLVQIPGHIGLETTYLLNKHSAFGVMRKFPSWASPLLLSISGVAVALAAVYSHQQAEKLPPMIRLGVFLFVLGALGTRKTAQGDVSDPSNVVILLRNGVDRLLAGGVIDYVSVFLGPYEAQTYNLAWNISDMVINVAFVCILLGTYQLEREEKEKEKERKKEAEEGGGDGEKKGLKQEN